MPRLTSSEKRWLAKHHPSILLIERATLTALEGKFRFRRKYNGHIIEDTYSLRISVPADESIPKVSETKGRLLKVLAKHPEFKGDLSELHMYTSEQLCLAAPQELRLIYKPNPNIKVFLTRYVEPYLYSQSYFEEHGWWPWPHLPHNTAGMLEWYRENYSLPSAAKETAVEIIKLAKKDNVAANNLIMRAKRRESFNPRSRCLCGSGQTYLKCHPTYARLALQLRQLAS